ncbi:unnamed protein product, partial [Brassica rapa]
TLYKLIQFVESVFWRLFYVCCYFCFSSIHYGFSFVWILFELPKKEIRISQL